MKLLDRVFFAQVVVVLCRPLVFIWSVSQISGAVLASSYLVALGLMPLFAIIDVLFQFSARHAFVVGAAQQRITSAHLLGAAGVFMAVIVAFFRWTSSADISGAVIALVAVYFFSAFMNKFEASISSSKAVFGMAITELLGYLICALVVLNGNAFIAAISATMVFPASRIITVVLNQKSRPATCRTSASTKSRAVFIGSAVSSQVFASLAAGAPSIVSLITPGAADRIGIALIIFKILFAASALLSTAVNLLSARVFYRVVNLEFGSKMALVKVFEMIISVGISIGLLIALVALPYVESSVSVFSIGLGIAFSHLNLLSSLAIMRGRPAVSAFAQASVCAGAFGLAFLINEKFIHAAGLLFLFLVCFYTLSRRVRVSSLLDG